MPSFTSLGLFLAGAGAALANSIEFRSQDDIARTIKCTPNAGLPEIPLIQVPGNQNVKVQYPTGWIGNCYAISEGAPDIPGMLAEVAFDQFNNLVFFDVSAIVNDRDVNGVKEMWPAQNGIPTSGCKIFPCNNVYVLWDDVQTKATPESDLICTLGGSGSVSARDLETAESDDPVFQRDFVLGRWSKST